MELVDRTLKLVDKDEVTRPVRGGAGVAYAVETSANGETLAERRGSGSAQSFRCPKSIYDALARTLGDADKAMPLDELVAAVARLAGDVPPEFQIRVPYGFG